MTASFEVMRIIAGSAFVLLAPGLAWSYVFFRRKSIDWIERVALSVGLSIVLVPLSVFWLNRLAGMRITFFNTAAVIMGLVFAAVVCVAARSLFRSPKPERLETESTPARRNDAA